MIALVQRVSEASVLVNGEETGAIGRGLLVLLGIHREDGMQEVTWMARKCADLRVFPDDEGRMNRSLVDIAGEALVVSQFTLYGDARKGNRPSFIQSAPPGMAEPLYEDFMRELSSHIANPVQSGVFGAMMDVRLVNDGPVTIWIERTPGQGPS